MSDLICTSSNAVKMVEHFKGEPLIFAPDRHLARFVAKETGRDDLIVWQGACVVHELFSAKGLAKLKVQHPDAEVLAHPECDQAVLDQADFIASTTGIIKRAVETPGHRSRSSPPRRGYSTPSSSRPLSKKLIQAARARTRAAPATTAPSCASIRPRSSTWRCAISSPRSTCPRQIRAKALRPIEKMLELS